MTRELGLVLEKQISLLLLREMNKHYFLLVQISPGGFLRACYAFLSIFASTESEG